MKEFQIRFIVLNTGAKSGESIDQQSSLFID
jgi:hypothetical protein